MKNLLPYIGITDFLNFNQVENMLSVFKKKEQDKYRLHVGVMMSYKTLHGLETKWSTAFPPKEDIYRIFASRQTMNCLHYADFGNDPDLAKSLQKAIEYGGYGMNALQLDMLWPNPDEVSKAIYYSKKDLEVVLQIGKQAIEQSRSLNEILRKIHDYDGIIHHVLLDKSMGKGLGMDAQGLLPLIESIREKFPNLGITVAGGLGPTTLNLLEPLLLNKINNFSIDAQGKLRSSGNALDPIEWNMAEEYLSKALFLLT